MSKKPIIVFEGIECSGKSTLSKITCNHLRKLKKNFINFREPGGSKNSEKIRKLILNKKSNFNKNSDLFLYLASRSENMEKIIKKNYKKKIIIIDRFIDSTIAYQHYGMGINRKLIENLNSFLLGNLKPDIIFINTISKKNLYKRLNNRRNINKYDKFKFNFYNKVQNGFLKLSKNSKKYCKINSNDTLAYNKKKVLNIIDKLIK